MTTQRDLIPISHRSFQLNRLRRSERVSGERLFAAAWRKWNKESNILGYVLAPDSNATGPVGYSRHDAAVAASVVQWLGTNVGLSFVRGVLKQIEILDDEQLNDVGRRRWWWRSEQLNAPFRVPRYRILKAQVQAARERLKRLAQEKETHR